MCGIIGYIGVEEKATNMIMEGLSKLEYRGYDSAGIAIFTPSGICVEKTKGKLVNLADHLAQIGFPQGCAGIGHTRWATHGEPSDVNAHPHWSQDHSVVVVHNGIIENYAQLREELIVAGDTFLSDTDTEIIPHIIARYYREDKDPVQAISRAIQRMRGSYALGIMFADRPGELYAARKDSPLIVGLGQNENYIASDIPAVLAHTRDVYLLEDYDIAILNTEEIRIVDLQGNPVRREIFHVTWDVASAEKGGFPHFMLKEIHEQPHVVRETLASRLQENLDAPKMDDLGISKEVLDGLERIYMVACGTAYHAAMVGKYLIERVARLSTIVETASEFRYRDPIIDEKTLVIVVSQSGETADTLAALRMSKQAGAKVLGIVNVVGSSISREADYVFYTWAGPEIAVASTKAYSCQLAAMYLLTAHFALLRGKMTPQEFHDLKGDLIGLPAKIGEILKKEEEIKAIVDSVDPLNVFYVGRGLDYYTGMEGSLKLKEIAYLHSEAYAAGELKHGPIAMIEPGTLVIGIVTQKSLIEKTVSNLKEVKARGAQVLCITTEDADLALIQSVADQMITIPDCNWMFTSLLANIPQQLLAYYMSVKKGYDVDKPRNLAKSVTVE
ncbi:MAG TPA: glutamine--fructose-6-phosphate transaminase (isomerizing) [Candidatus Faecimorpha stercoravium]|nr:glutamine--fructose-6-phosphate transaminase (isomerizing) [Candidatus Faecimorpha stercoravium]